MSNPRKARNHALAKVAEHTAKRRWHLARGNAAQAAKHLKWARRWRERAQDALVELRRSRGKAPCPRAKYTFRSAKNFLTRPRITPRLLVLHSTESSPGYGFNVGSYLSHGSTQADVHVIIDADGTSYRLVPDGRKAWHVGVSNGFTLGIEQVGRAAQTTWPEAQLRAVARQLACWSRKYDIPLVDARRNLAGKGVVDHDSLPGDHTDPGRNYPFEYVLKLAREYL